MFTIPGDDRSVALGQVINMRKHNFLVVIYDARLDVTEATSDLVDRAIEYPLLLMGNTMDAAFNAGEWHVLGCVSENLRRTVELPLYRVTGGGETLCLVDHNNEIIRHCTQEEWDLLSPFEILTPWVLQGAVQSHFGTGPTYPSYRKLKVDEFLKGTRIVRSKIP